MTAPSAGGWPRAALGSGRKAGGKTLGRVGFGSIGMRIDGAAVDVHDTEPLPAGSPLAGCPNLVLTPQIAGVSAEANVRVSQLIAERVLDALSR